MSEESESFNNNNSNDDSTIVMMTVLAVKEILWDSAISTNFVLHQYCVE